MIKDRPYVTVDLEPRLQDFLLHEFGVEKDVDGVVINTANDIGKMILAMVTPSDRPYKQADKENLFNIYLPIQGITHRIFTECFIYVPEWKQVQLRNYVEACFRLRIREFFLAGYEKGFRQDKITNAFLDAYNIKNGKLNYETIVKYDYRNRKKVTKEVRETIQLSLFEN